MATFDRTELIALLDRLAHPDDAEIVKAAQGLQECLTELQLGWDDLIVLDPADVAAGRNADRTDSDGIPDSVGARPAAGDGAEMADDSTASSRDSDRALLASLLARSSLSEETRAELEALRADAESGCLAPIDRRYLRSLTRRIGEGGAAPAD